MLGAEPHIVENYIKTGQLRLIFNPVLNHGDRSRQTHQAAECAGEQGQFWAYRDFLFEQQDRLWRGDIRETVKVLAGEMGLDTASFNACLDEQRHLPLVEGQDALRIERGVRLQPTFQINDELLYGSQPFEVFQSVIDAKLGL